MSIEVVIPISTTDHADIQRLAPSPNLGKNATVGLIDNGKLNADNILRGIAEQMIERGLAGGYRMIHKPTAVKGLDDQTQAALLREVQWVITGVGDCGACSSWTVIDAMVADQAGVPAIPIVTTPFAVLAKQTGKNRGYADYPTVVIEHPIYGRSDGWLSALACRVCDDIVEHLEGVRQPVESEQV